MEVLVSAKGVPVADWIMVASIPTEEAFEPIHEMNQRVLQTALLLGLLLSALTWWTLRRELKPMLTTVKTLTTLSYRNPAALWMLGAQSARDLVGKRILDLVHPDFRASVMKRVQDSYDHGADQLTTTERYLKLDGSPIDVEVQSISTIFDRLPAVQVAIRDITERKRIEARPVILR